MLGGSVVVLGGRSVGLVGLVIVGGFCVAVLGFGWWVSVWVLWVGVRGGWDGGRFVLTWSEGRWSIESASAPRTATNCRTDRASAT